MEVYMKVGDRVTKRGSEGAGKIVDIRELWVSVIWEPGFVRKPAICHVRELEKA